MAQNEFKNGHKRAYTVVEPFRVKTVTGVKELKPGATLNLTSEKATGLLRQGFITEAASSGILIEWRTESGKTIYLAEAPHATANVPPGRAFFLPEELEAMSGLDRHTADLLIDAKEVFPGCTVERTDAQNGPVERLFQ